MFISERDREIVRCLREEAGVLQNIDNHRLDHSRGVIMVACADGDQMPDIFAHHSGICLSHATKPRIHLLSLNGGALLIPESSVLNQRRRQDKVLLDDIEVAQGLKFINLIALYAHIPCGMAAYARLDALHVIDLLIQAKERIKQILEDVTVGCFVHVDKGEGGKRTYFVSREAWRKWKESGNPYKSSGYKKSG